jgi:hypothetical protein
MSWHPPMLGFDATAPFVHVQWKDGTSCGGILGTQKLDPERLAQLAYEEELRTLHDNVVLLDDYRRKAWVSEDPSSPEDKSPGAA